MTTETGYKGDLVSYLTLRRIVGALGVSLPIIVALWGFALSSVPQILPSISDYYSLRTRDVFVGILFTIAWFLFSYRGYERKDDIAGNLACIFALGVALSPNSGTQVERYIHFSCACALFLVLAYFAFFLFTKSSGDPTPEKRTRNVIYRTCGGAIVLCIVLIGIYRFTLEKTQISHLHPIFWLESLSLWAFGISWFVKGETLFKDPEANTVRHHSSLTGSGLAVVVLCLLAPRAWAQHSSATAPPPAPTTLHEVCRMAGASGGRMQGGYKSYISGIMLRANINDEDYGRAFSAFLTAKYGEQAAIPECRSGSSRAEAQQIVDGWMKGTFSAQTTYVQTSWMYGPSSSGTDTAQRAPAAPPPTPH